MKCFRNVKFKKMKCFRNVTFKTWNVLEMRRFWNIVWTPNTLLLCLVINVYLFSSLPSSFPTGQRWKEKMSFITISFFFASSNTVLIYHPGTATLSVALPFFVGSFHTLNSLFRVTINARQFHFLHIFIIITPASSIELATRAFRITNCKQRLNGDELHFSALRGD